MEKLFIAGFLGQEVIDKFFASAAFKKEESHAGQKKILAELIQQKRLAEGFAVKAIDEQYGSFNDRATAEYLNWDNDQAEKILDSRQISVIKTVIKTPKDKKGIMKWLFGAADEPPPISFITTESIPTPKSHSALKKVNKNDYHFNGLNI